METNYDERAIRSVNHRPGRYDIEIDGDIVGTLTRISDKSWYGKARGQAIIADEITAHWWVCDPWDQHRPWQTYAAFDPSGRKVDGTDVVQAPSAHHALTTIAETAEDVLPPLIADDDRAADTVELVDHDGSDRYPPVTIAIVGF